MEVTHAVSCALLHAGQCTAGTLDGSDDLLVSKAKPQIHRFCIYLEETVSLQPTLIKETEISDALLLAAA